MSRPLRRLSSLASLRPWAEPPRGRGTGARHSPGPPILFAAAVAWLAGWAVAVHLQDGPLPLDRLVDRPLLSASAGWHHASAWLLTSQTPGAMVLTAVVLGAVAARLAAWRSAVTVVAGTAIEMVVLQWVVKPLVDRHEIAPAAAFPSSYAGAACALATVTVMLFRRRGPVGRRLESQGYRWFAWLVCRLAVLDAAAVSVATIVTGGHLFSDVIAAIPWGIAVPVAVSWAIGLAAANLGARWRSSGEPNG